jgi:hypothetical protein
MNFLQVSISINKYRWPFKWQSLKEAGMKKIFLFLVLIALFTVSSAFCQIAKIVDVQGEVRVKRKANLAWEKARLQMFLWPESEVKTEELSECTIAFDEELQNVLTIKENSHIRIEDIRPVKLFLPKGRVFSLIDDIAQLQEFQVRTPTAVAGVRGTGKSLEADDNGTTVKCFKGKTWVAGLDDKGSQKATRDLWQGTGISVGPGGILGDIFNLTGQDYKEWDAFEDFVEGRRASSRSPRKQDDFLDELKEEKKYDLRDDFFEDQRRHTEERHEPPEKPDDDNDDRGGGMKPY